MFGLVGFCCFGAATSVAVRRPVHVNRCVLDGRLLAWQTAAHLSGRSPTIATLPVYSL